MDSQAYRPPLPSHLEVKLSLIPNAGMGLFARREIKEDRRICQYRGYSYRDSDKLEASHKPYLVYLDSGEVRDGYQMNNHARWANHKKSIEGRDPNDPEEPNAWLQIMQDKVVYLRSLRKIEEGEEIYIDYGYDPTKPDEEEIEPPPPARASDQEFRAWATRNAEKLTPKFSYV